jgi:hypothetical protein
MSWRYRGNKSIGYVLSMWSLPSGGRLKQKLNYVNVNMTLLSSVKEKYMSLADYSVEAPNTRPL